VAGSAVYPSIWESPAKKRLKCMLDWFNGVA
jgi:hypothetical protein